VGFDDESETSGPLRLDRYYLLSDAGSFYFDPAGDNDGLFEEVFVRVLCREVDAHIEIPTANGAELEPLLDVGCWLALPAVIDAKRRKYWWPANATETWSMSAHGQRPDDDAARRQAFKTRKESERMQHADVAPRGSEHHRAVHAGLLRLRWPDYDPAARGAEGRGREGYRRMRGGGSFKQRERESADSKC
jgi:hypothetical protein